MRIQPELYVRITTTLSLLFVCFLASAQRPFPLDDSSPQHRLDHHVGIFIDSTNTLSEERVTANDFQQHFKHSNGNLTFGYLKSTIWLKVFTHSKKSTTSLVSRIAGTLPGICRLLSVDGQWFF